MNPVQLAMQEKARMSRTCARFLQLPAVAGIRPLHFALPLCPLLLKFHNCLPGVLAQLKWPTGECEETEEVSTGQNKEKLHVILPKKLSRFLNRAPNPLPKNWTFIGD